MAMGLQQSNEIKLVNGELQGITRESAHEKGILVNLNNYIPLKGAPHGCQISCTKKVWGLIEKAVNNPKFANDYEGIIWDILSMGANSMGYSTARQKDLVGMRYHFTAYITGAGKKRYFQFMLKIHRGDKGEVVGTISLISNDPSIK